MAEQSPDPWRLLWRFGTSNELLITLLLAIAASLALTAWIPQRPSSDMDYALWLSQTQARFGEATSVMRALGVFSIIPSFGFRTLLALLSGCVFLQLVEGVDRLRKDQEVVKPDGSWQQISGRQLTKLLDCLRRRRYRVVNTSSLFFQIDRWPWSGVFPLIARLGALLLLLSLLLSYLVGWEAEGLILQRDERRSLPRRDDWVALTEDGTAARHSPGVVVFVEDSGPGVEVSAVDGTGESLQLLLTSEGEPSTELKVALTGDTDFAIPEAALVVRLTPQSDEPYTRVDVQIYSSPTGDIISERVTDEGGQAVFSIGEVTLALDPAPYARVTATHNPGQVPAGLGLGMLMVGLMGSLTLSQRRFWLREGEILIEAAGPFPSWLQDEEDTL